MAMTEPKIENLLARHERTLTSVQRAISELEAREKLTEKQRARLDHARAREHTALQARTRLTELSSGFHQKERYGTTRWNRQFQRVSEIQVTPENNPRGLTLSDTDLQNRVITAISWTPFFRFQSAYCKPKDFIVPKFQIGDDGKIRFIGLTEEQLRNLSVAGCLVSPDRLPTSLVESLRFHQFTADEQKDPLTILQIKAAPKVTDTLKMIFDAGEFINGSHTRVLVLATPEPALRARYGHAADMGEGLAGTVLYFRHHVGAELAGSRHRNPNRWRSAAPVYAQHFPTVLKAYRRALHAGRKYGTEYEVLVGVLQNLSEMRTDVATNWRRGTGAEGNAAILQRVREKVIKDLEQLEKVLDPNKKKVRDLMLEFASLRDSLGRLNPTAKEAQIRAAISPLERRIRSLIPLGGYTEQDRKELWKVCSDQAKVLLEFRKGLEAPGVEDVLVSAARSPRPSSAEVKSSVLQTVAPNRSRFSELHVRPFSTFAKALRCGLEDLERAVSRGSTAEGLQAVARMHLICRVSALTIGIAQLEEKLSDPSTCDGPAALKLAQTVLDRSRASKFEKRLTQAEQNLIGSLIEKLHPVTEKLRQSTQMNGDDRATLFAEAKEELATILPERSVFLWLRRRRIS